MKLKRKLIIMALLAVPACLVFFCLPQHAGIAPGYDSHIFYPFQSLRGWLLGSIPFSLGDLVYFACGIWLVATLIKWVYYIVRFGLHKEGLLLSLLQMVNTLLFAYLFFVIGWGANYFKPTLREYWQLTPPDNTAQNDTAKAERKKKALENLTVFDQLLVDRLNTYAPHYHTLLLAEINRRAISYYAAYTDSRVAVHGLHIKPTIYAYFIERLGIEGFYNPFTGEGQVNASLPAFIMPFLVCHEMAHQAGIAAEEDANLMAYAIGTITSDSTFRYACYLNIWEYTNRRLYNRDSVTALKHEAMLNKLTTAHLDTLEQISRKYNNEVSRYSNDLYDSYLKMQDQKEGIRSYGNVATSAWLLEQKRMTGTDKLIRIP